MVVVVVVRRPSDLIFAAALWGLVAVAGAELAGTVEGVALWRYLFLAAVAAHVGLVSRPPNEEKAT